jgi:DNA polymerase-3 subunit delta
VHAWRHHARSQQLDVEVFDAPARLDDLRRSVSEVPLLDPERTILVRDPPQLSGAGRRGADPPERLATILAERPPTTAVCLVAHARVAPQNVVLQAVRSLGGRISYFPPPRGREVRAWLEAQVSARGLHLEPGTVDQLLQAIGPELGALSTELDKLEALAAGSPLTAAEVQEVVAGDAPMETYGLLDQLVGAQPGRAASTVDRLLARGSPTQYLLAILAGQVRDVMLTQAHLHQRGTAAGLAGELRVPEWRAERLVRQARALTPAMASRWLRALHDADRLVKSGDIGDADALRLVIARAAEEVRG